MIVSGYARGVDTETHLAALGSGGCTAIVLAEGITHFRRKRAFSGVEFDPNRIVVLSQFSPKQAWRRWSSDDLAIGGSVGLGTALVVIEAGETGGTLDAGMRLLRAAGRCSVLSFPKMPPPQGTGFCTTWVLSRSAVDSSLRGFYTKSALHRRIGLTGNS